MSYSIAWSRQALKTLKRLSKQDQSRILDGVEQFASTEYGDIKKLKAVKDDEYRLRIGPWRVRFKISEDSSEIVISDVFNRSSGYNR